MCTPMFRWLAEQSRQRYIPNGTDVHVGFFAPQSKHIWWLLAEYIQGCHCIGVHIVADLVGGLGFELLEYLEGLGFGC